MNFEQDEKSGQNGFVEFCGNGSDTRELAGQRVSPADVLQYIHEMCVTLAYMSSTYGYDRLSGSLDAAAHEAQGYLRVLADEGGNCCSVTELQEASRRRETS